MILLAPIVIRVAKALEVDFVAPVVLTAIISNSAGLLTLVGDPATFLVGSSIGMSFGEYLQKVSLGGLLSVLVLIPILPWMLKDIWRVRRTLPDNLSVPPIERPSFCLLALLVLVLMIVLFLVGETLPIPVVPPSVAIIGASLALLVVSGLKVESVDRVLTDVDWKKLLFLTNMFLMVEAFTRTGILQGLSVQMTGWFGTDLLLVAIVTGAGAGIGRGIAEIFAAPGGSVVVSDLHGDNAEAVANAIREAGGQAIDLACNVTDKPTVQPW